MSISGWYGRVAIKRLLAVIGDRQATAELVHGTVHPVSDGDPAEVRSLCIGTTWDALDYLLESADGPVEIVAGNIFEPRVESATYLTDDQVRHAANWLAAVSFDDLLSSVDPDNPGRDIYKTDLADPVHQQWIRESYDALTSFFGTAARHDEAVLIIWG